jgi:hypothetical protein
MTAKGHQYASGRRCAAARMRRKRPFVEQQSIGGVRPTTGHAGSGYGYGYS